MATIQTRKGKSGTTYRVGYYADGKLTWTPTMADLDGAERVKAIIETQGPDVALRILNAQQDGGTTLAEWFEKHLILRKTRATEGTLAGYRREAARTWLPQLGPLPLKAVTRDAVTDWIAWQMDQPTDRSVKAREKAVQAGFKGSKVPPLVKVSPKTVRNAHALLSSVLDTAHQAEMIDRNPAKGVDVPKDNVREEKDIFTRTEWDRFYYHMDDHYKPLTAFLLTTGARIGEATAVRVRDLKVSTSAVHIVRAWKKAAQGQELGTPKSRRSRRVVVVPTWALQAFREAAKGKGPDDLLFTTPTGARVHGHRYGERQWKRALTKAGIDKHLTPHSARHTFASWALMSGIAPQTVQHRLGHESLQTTSEVYGHLLLDAQAAAVDAIGWEPAAQIEA